MTETTESLDCDGFAAHDMHLAHRIEDRDASAEERRVACCVNVLGNVNDGFRLEDAVFGI